MKVIITGGGGFLGSQLAEALLVRGELTGASGNVEPIEELVLLDARFGVGPTVAPVRRMEGDITERAVIEDAIGGAASFSIFHLASMVSGECEDRYDDALRVNLDGGRHIFEAARAATEQPRVVFASSVASFGGEGMPTPAGDLTKHTPSTTYGMTKAICELLLNDHVRMSRVGLQVVPLIADADDQVQHLELFVHVLPKANHVAARLVLVLELLLDGLKRSTRPF